VSEIGLSRIAKLLELVTTMEEDLGLDRLSADERMMIYAISSIWSESRDIVRSAELKQHRLCRNFSNPTFYRTLKALLDKGYVARVGPRKTGGYQLEVINLRQDLI